MTSGMPRAWQRGAGQTPLRGGPKQGWWTFNTLGCARARLDGNKIVEDYDARGRPIFGWPRNDDGSEDRSYKFQWIRGRFSGVV